MDYFDFSYIIFLVAYSWFALCLYIIARKTDTPNSWLAWIPLANFYLICRVAGKPGWWTILLCLPFITFVILLFTFMATGEKSPAWFMPLLALTIVLGFIYIVLFVKVWSAIAKARHKPSWLGILMIIPAVNLLIPGILAFSD
jgi:hypothetical protein